MGLIPDGYAGEGDGLVDQHELDLIDLYWGADCSESFMGGGGGTGSGGGGDVVGCVTAALASNLTGEEFVEYLLACLDEHDLLD